MIKKGEKVVLALSGGKDSTVLLHLLADLRKYLPFELVSFTIDEGIKGYRSPSVKLAEKESKKLGVPHTVFSFKQESGFTLDEIVKRTKMDAPPCSYCGVIRRYLLNRGAKELAGDKLAVGHNLDDVAQTVLMNLMRNEPMRLLRFGEPLVESKDFIPRIRPLLRAPEKEIALYAISNDISVQFDECPYSKHAFRKHVREQLNETEELQPGTKFKIVNSFFEIQKMIKNGVKKEQLNLNNCINCGEHSSDKYCMYCKMVEKIKLLKPK